MLITAAFVIIFIDKKLDALTFLTRFLDFSLVLQNISTCFLAEIRKGDIKVANNGDGFILRDSLLLIYITWR